MADTSGLALIGGATFLETFAGILIGSAIIAHCERAHSALAYRDILSNGGRAWIAELNPGLAPVGFAVMAPADILGMRTNDIELKRIYILSRMHGLGLGADLMNRVVDAAREAGHDRLLLGVYAENSRAIEFYKKQGFEPISTRQFDVGGTKYNDLVLAKLVSE